jgi:hypothetical protein
MRKNIKFILVFVIVLSILGTFFMANLNAATSTHEAEDSSNKLKYASVSGDYVEFDAKKDAYVEMKNVNSTSSGEMSLTFYYVADNSFPLELKVNGSTVASKDTISSTSSGTVTYQASMNSGDDNSIRFKIRDAVSGIKLDKVIISDGDSNQTEEPSSTVTTEPTDDTTDDTTASEGDITLNSGDSLENAINSISAGNTIYLNSGTYKYSSTIVIEESNKGTSSKMKNIVGKGNVVIDFSTMSEDSANRGIVLDGSYWSVEVLQ